ncbi:MAG: hypothetical protein IJO76_02495 [Clostridia bacterium]|nr:hypothetical protein [Clostridia bacterium]
MQELNLKTLVDVLLQNLKWILIFGIILAVLFGGYKEFFVEDSYASTCSMYVMNLTTTDNGTASTTAGISSTGLTASQQMVNEYIALLKSNMIIDDVAVILHQQGYDLTNKQIRATLRMSSKDESALMEIRATTSDPALCKAICDAIMATAPAKIKKVMLNLGSINPVDSANLGTRVSSGSLRTAFIGGVIGCVLAYGLFLLLNMLDNTIKSEQDIRIRLNVPVLGSVPDLHPGQSSKKKGGNGYYG